MVEPKQPDLKVLLPLSCPLFPSVLLPRSMSSFLYVSSSCISRIVFPYRGQFDLKAVACIAPVSVWDSAREHLNGALGHRICNREQKRGVRKSSLILWPPSSPPPLCPKLIKISTWRWWVTESTSVRQTEPRWDDVSCAWPGHQPLFTAQITISKVNSAMATCKEESPLHSPKKKKRKSFLLRNVTQNNIYQWETRPPGGATISLYSEVIRFSDFPNPSQDDVNEPREPCLDMQKQHGALSTQPGSWLPEEGW